MKNKTIFRNRDDGKNRISFMISFTIILILAVGVGAALFYAVIYDTQVKTTQVRRDLAAQRETNAALKTDVTQRYTLDEVERIAVERLGMNKPDSSQVIRIYVPKQSYVELNNDTDGGDVDYNILDGIANFITDAVRRLLGQE